jgi:hypothetical protein
MTTEHVQASGPEGPETGGPPEPPPTPAERISRALGVPAATPTDQDAPVVT